MEETDGVSDGLNKGVDEGVIKGVNEGVNEGVKKGVIEDISAAVRNGMIAVVDAIMNKKEIRANMIAKKLSLSVSTIERYIDLLKKIGLVEYKGAPKTGTYYLTDKMKSKLKTKE
jgi:ATP-dependent DNA helicase RecG